MLIGGKRLGSSTDRFEGCALFHAETLDTELIGGTNALKHIERPCGAKKRKGVGKGHVLVPSLRETGT